MSRAASHAPDRKTGLPHSLARLFENNSALLVGVAFGAGMLLGRRTNVSLAAKKVRSGVSNLADHVVELAPSSVIKLVPDIFPAKARKSPRRKSAAKKRAHS